MKFLKLIVCCDKNYGIGKQGQLPWRIKSEMEHFKRKTTKNGNNMCIMGRKTYYSIPDKYRPLSKRKSLIISGMSCPEKEDTGNTHWFHSIDDCLNYAKCNSQNYDECWVIGGKSIYRSILLNYAIYIDEIHLSKLHEAYDCDQYLKLSLEKYALIESTSFEDFNYQVYKQY